MNNKVVRGYFYLGQMHKIEKDQEKALHYFSKVLSLEPNHHEAQRELRLMEKSKTKDAGKLKGLFRKKS